MFYVQIEIYISYFTKIFHLLEDPDGNLLGCIRVAQETETKNMFSIKRNSLKLYKNILKHIWLLLCGLPSLICRGGEKFRRGDLNEHLKYPW